MNYQEFVRSRFKPGEKIAEEMTPHKAMWLALKSFYVFQQAIDLDKVKKYAIYNKLDSEVSGWSQLGVTRYKNFKPTPDQCELLHAAIGLAGEAGELLDTVRKHVFDGQPLDRDNVIEELGDLCFYLEAAMQVIGISREEIEQRNMTKLSKRYEGGYTDQQAVARADKAGEE